MGSARFELFLAGAFSILSGALRPDAGAHAPEPFFVSVAKSALIEEAQTRLPLIPYPASVEERPAESHFQLRHGTEVLVGDGILNDDFLVQSLKDHLDKVCAGSSGGGGVSGSISLSLDTSDSTPPSSRLGGDLEGYSLTVNADGVELVAASTAGLFNGVQTLRQLTLFDAEETPYLPAVTIKDVPRFEWRGLHLDVSRHFFDAAEVKRLINAMSLFKLNRFHWHLSDDQGWRLPVDGYPKLTQVGANGLGGIGAYTKAEIKDVVAYAQARRIQVIPEIDVPGHATAAIAAYPGLGNADVPDWSSPAGPQHTWGTFSYTLAPSNSTWTFLNKVYDTLAELFPGTYVHLGGDEVSSEEWSSSPLALSILEHLPEGEDYPQNALLEMDSESIVKRHNRNMQTIFNQRVSALLHARDRRPVGWDEVQDMGGMSEDGIVMAWRSGQSVLQAVREGRQVINSDQGVLYFDHYQGPQTTEPMAFCCFTDLKAVYEHDPVPFGITEEQASLVVGTQGQLWTEYMSNFSHVEYMAFPRSLALAERAWTPSSGISSFSDFTHRLRTRLGDLDHLGVNYRKLTDL